METKGMDVSDKYMTSSYIVTAVTVITAISVIVYGCCTHPGWLSKFAIIMIGLFVSTVAFLVIHIVYFLSWYWVCKLMKVNFLDTDVENLTSDIDGVPYNEDELSKF